MPAAQRALLLFGEAFEPVIPLPSRTRPVLVHAVKDAKDGQAAGSDLATEVDGMAGVVLGSIGLLVRPPDIAHKSPTSQRMSTKQEGQAGTDVATIPPIVPRVTTYAEVTARTEGPAELFIAQLRKPGPPGKAPTVTKYKAMYRMFGVSTHRRMAKPMIARIEKEASQMPLWCDLSLP